jgi:peptidoglycan/LPS O-acetylase OafA/YrhL
MKLHPRAARSLDSGAAVRAAPVGYPALDGWRGICACLVALFHFRIVWDFGVNSHIAQAALVQHASLFVDFFFVLSGFVIAYRYRDAVRARTVTLRAFLALRLGRLYPLHLFTLLLVLALVLFFRYGTHGATHVTWDGSDVTPGAFLANLFLVQALHVLPGSSWNKPSWSISAEFATYVVYAVLWRLFGARTWVVSAIVLIAAPVLLLIVNGTSIDVTYDWGFVRAMLGFALGTIAFSVSRDVRVRALLAQLSRAESTVIEVVLLAFVYVTVTVSDGTPYSLSAPFLFAGVVLVFSEAHGAVTGALLSPVMQWLGRLSYSIYMLHFPLQVALIYLAVALAASGQTWLFALNADTRGARVILGRSPWAGDAATLIMMLVVVGASLLIYRWIEQPWRARVRRWAAVSEPHPR